MEHSEGRFAGRPPSHSPSAQYPFGSHPPPWPLQTALTLDLHRFSHKVHRLEESFVRFANKKLAARPSFAFANLLGPTPGGLAENNFFEEPISIGAAREAPADKPSHYLANLHHKP